MTEKAKDVDPIGYERPVSFTEYCNCGGYRSVMKGYSIEHPHRHWCRQYLEWEHWVRAGWMPWLPITEYRALFRGCKRATPNATQCRPEGQKVPNIKQFSCKLADDDEPDDGFAPNLFSTAQMAAEGYASYAFWNRDMWERGSFTWNVDVWVDDKWVRYGIEVESVPEFHAREAE